MAARPPAAVFVLVVLVVVLVLAGALLAARAAAAGPARALAAATSRLLLPAGEGPHTHEVALGAAGSGTSAEGGGHRHAVADFADVGVVRPDNVVAPADHVHELG